MCVCVCVCVINTSKVSLLSSASERPSNSNGKHTILFDELRIVFHLTSSSTHLELLSSFHKYHSRSHFARQKYPCKNFQHARRWHLKGLLEINTKANKGNVVSATLCFATHHCVGFKHLFRQMFVIWCFVIAQIFTYKQHNYFLYYTFSSL